MQVTSVRWIKLGLDCPINAITHPVLDDSPIDA